jgi:hypothetical protein
MDDKKFEFMVEVGRAGYELELRHGLYASAYAKRLAAQADKNGDVEDKMFWQAVARHLEPRAPVEQN